MIITKYPNKRERNGILNISREAIIYKNAALIDTDYSLDGLLSFGIFHDGIEITDIEYESRKTLDNYFISAEDCGTNRVYIMYGGRYRSPISLELSELTINKVNEIYETINRLHPDEP